MMLPKFRPGTKVKWKTSRDIYRHAVVIEHWQQYGEYGSGYEISFDDDPPATTVGLFQEDELELVPPSFGELFGRKR